MSFDDLFAHHRMAMSRALLWPLGIIILLTTSRWENYPVIAGGLFLIGCILIGIATVGRLWCSLYICGYKTHTLITQGPYSICRNPLYLFSLIGVIGLGLATETVSLPIVLGLLFAFYYPSVVRKEESKLMSVHGLAFEQYKNAVPRFWPRIRGVLLEPDSYAVSPVRFRRAMLSALWFVWLVGLLEVFEAFREMGILPSLLLRETPVTALRKLFESLGSVFCCVSVMATPFVVGFIVSTL